MSSQPNIDTTTVGVVIIGRNEGERLRACIESVLPQAQQIVFVDSGSTDDSVALAKSLGCDVVELDMDRPFTAGRGRNAGYRHLLVEHPELQFIQFIDGDCLLDANWLATALAKMATDAKIAAVCGRRRERFPEATIYNQLCDMEWNTPIGQAAACGGDSLMRVEPLVAVDGFNVAFAAGEEPDLCFRMRQNGWTVWRIDAEMTLHDAAMTEFGQWWQRMVRSGSAYAQGAWTHGNSAEKYDVRDSLRIWQWAFVVPALMLGLWRPTRGYSKLLLLGYPYLGWRVYQYRRRQGDAPRNALIYATFNVIGKFAQLVGQLRFLKHRQSRLIEYK